MARQVTDRRPSIILSRPRHQAESFARALGDVRADVVLSPALDIRPVAGALGPDADEELILTSQNAVGMAQQAWDLSGRTAYVVGHATAALAQSAGLLVTGVAEHVEGLVDLILTRSIQKKLIHLRGRHTTGGLTQKLADAGLRIRDSVIYDQCPLPLSAEAQLRLSDKQAVIFPLFSARTARIISENVSASSIRAPVHLVSISATVDLAWSGPTPASRCHAATPDAEAMIGLIRLVLDDLT